MAEGEYQGQCSIRVSAAATAQGPRVQPSLPGLCGPTSAVGVRTGLGSIPKSLIWSAPGGLGWVRGAGLPVLALLGASASPSPGHSH